MKTKLTLLAILLTAFSVCSRASEYYKAETDLNVRAGAGIRYSVYYTLKKGDEVEFISKNGNWYKIKHSKGTGYANSKYLVRTRSIPALKIDWKKVQFALIIVILIIAFYILFKVFTRIRDYKLLQSVTDRNRGTWSERELVLMLLKAGIPKHRIFHDLYVEKGKEEFSQTDLVVLTEVGIIVFEVKDYSGWIFGAGHESQWLQVLAYGKQKFRFYNPIKQNNTHIFELRKQLYGFESIPYYSVIVFYGDCVLKNIKFVPEGIYVIKSTRVLEVVEKILTENRSYFYGDEDKVIRILGEAVTKGGIIQNQNRHHENLNNMLGTNRVLD